MIILHGSRNLFFLCVEEDTKAIRFEVLFTTLHNTSRDVFSTTEDQFRRTVSQLGALTYKGGHDLRYARKILRRAQNAGAIPLVWKPTLEQTEAQVHHAYLYISYPMREEAKIMIAQANKTRTSLISAQRFLNTLAHSTGRALPMQQFGRLGNARYWEDTLSGYFRPINDSNILPGLPSLKDTSASLARLAKRLVLRLALITAETPLLEALVAVLEEFEMDLWSEVLLKSEESAPDMLQSYIDDVSYIIEVLGNSTERTKKWWAEEVRSPAYTRNKNKLDWEIRSREKAERFEYSLPYPSYG